MKKLNILIALINFLWFITCIPIIALILFFSIYMFINPEVLNIIKVSGESIVESNWLLQLLILLTMGLILVCIYAFYLFRETLRYFRRRKPFDDFVINTYSRIGSLLLVLGILGTISAFIFPLYLESKLTISLGISPYLSTVCLGLFFMVLSETFKIAKKAKQENDLTI